MPTKIEVEEVLRGLFSDLRDVIQARREAENDLANRCPDLVSEIASHENKLLDLQDTLDDLKAELMTQDSTLSDEISSFVRREAEIRNRIKEAAYSVNPEEASGGISIQPWAGWKLSVSKVQTKISYKTEDLLRDFPVLEDEKVDGDPLVVRSIDNAILARLCASGVVNSEDLSPYRVVTKQKNPSVRFTIGEDNE